MVIPVGKVVRKSCFCSKTGREIKQTAVIPVSLFRFPGRAKAKPLRPQASLASRRPRRSRFVA